MRISRLSLSLISALNLIAMPAYAFQEYDFKVLNAQNKDQFVIKEIDRFYKSIELDDVDEIKKDEYKQYLISNTKSKYGNSALVYAIQENSQKVFTYLSQSTDLNINNVNNSGENPLMMAAFKGNAKLVKFLLENRKAEVNKDGWSPIHYAVIRGDLEVVNSLINAGAEVDALSPNESTPLMYACRYGHIRVVKLLLDKGADLSAVNNQDLTPIDFARMYNQNEIARGLESRWFKLYKVEYEPLVDNLPKP
jgi:ankyrin repeat protein